MIDLVAGLLTGNRRALARLLTLVENDQGDAALAELYPHTGKAWIIGVTGAPGTGKSTLVNEVTKTYRAGGKTVGIIAVDPTSPFSGGAILGDRIRMRDLSGDPGVFIRSMATRGNLGGLARATRDAIRVLDAAGFDVVIVETVGAGQNEVDIVRTAHTTIVVEAPGLGDDVQAIKAGILEIADVLVVNKADRHGVNHTVNALKMMLELGHPADKMSHHGRTLAVQTPAQPPANAPLWQPPILQTVAAEGKGVADVLSAIDQHRAHLEHSGQLALLEAERIQTELLDRLRDALLAKIVRAMPPDTVAELVKQIQTRQLDPHSAVDALLRFL
ncbi:MAG: methylmalonyl Co-A mutase-associated GTPase MeaB [Anaerolinea sp.]|nr:methylmalonyl Co-A mutase-associated GTPase MeaB [Anaerolinea sp.]